MVSKSSKIFNAIESKKTEKYFAAFLNKHRIEYRMHRSRTSAYFNIVFDGKTFLIRISDHSISNTEWEIPDFEILCEKNFRKLKNVFKKVIKLSYMTKITVDKSSKIW
jgi:hypothetical protein